MISLVVDIVRVVLVKVVFGAFMEVILIVTRPEDFIQIK